MIDTCLLIKFLKFLVESRRYHLMSWLYFTICIKWKTIKVSRCVHTGLYFRIIFFVKFSHKCFAFFSSEQNVKIKRNEKKNSRNDFSFSLETIFYIDKSMKGTERHRLHFNLNQLELDILVFILLKCIVFYCGVSI